MLWRRPAGRTPVDDIPALSVRQPWASAIIFAGKDIENRGRASTYRGPLLIHASAGMTADERAEFDDFVRERGLGSASSFPRGNIIGLVDMVDCISESSSPWFVGKFGFVLANPRPLPCIPCKGTVFPLIWRPDAGVQALIRGMITVPA